MPGSSTNKFQSLLHLSEEIKNINRKIILEKKKLVKNFYGPSKNSNENHEASRGTHKALFYF